MKTNNNIVVVNKEKFEEVKKDFKKGGLENICLLTDFDKTLTYGTFNGKKVPSMIAVLRNENNYLGEDYVERASFLAEKYRPIELNADIEESEKRKEMESWWQNHIKLLIEKKLNKKHFRRVVGERVVGFRDGVKDVFEILRENNVPIIIISASGIGEDPIQMMIKKELGEFPNVFIISNSFAYDKDGNVVAYKEPIIHTMNKDDVLIEKRSFYNKIKDKKNILLLGDSLDDVKMAENIDYENLLKVCFLDEYSVKMIEHYKKLYDVLVLNDSSMDFVKGFLIDIVN
jgi:cytosolic 5'-nucleotidase 3